MKAKFLIISALFCTLCLNGIGQQSAAIAPAAPLVSTGVTSSSNVCKDTTLKCTCKTDNFTVCGIRDLKDLNPDTNGIHTFSFDDILVIRFKENIDSIVNLTKNRKLVLWFNGIPYRYLSTWSVNPAKHELAFKLSYDSARVSWDILYQIHYRKIRQTLNIQIGTETKTLSLLDESGNKTRIYFNTTMCWMQWAAYLILGALIVLFGWLIIKKRLLRDTPAFSPEVIVTKDPNIKPDHSDNLVYLRDIPYSLARSQLCFWLFIIAGSFVYIWFDTGGDLPNLYTSTALLLGISGGTSFVSTIIENSHRNSTGIKLSAIDFYNGYKSEKFFTDILSDENGISISRLQMVIFTFILGLYFVWYVAINLEIFDFPNTLLLLMGISSSTYAGIKYNEKTV